VSLCIPPFCVGAGSTGSLSVSQSKAMSNYASVTEQSGLQAGDGGFQIDVKGYTDLKGAVIASSEHALQAGKNSLSTATLTTSDIKNYAEASASSSGINLSSDMFSQGKYGAAKSIIGNALNNANESETSRGRTLSAVSGGVVSITNDEQQRKLIGLGAEETLGSLNRNVASTHASAQRQDVTAMKEVVEAERTIKQETIKIVSIFNDGAYRSRFKETPSFLKVVCPEGGNCVTEPDKLKRTLVTQQEVAANISLDMVLAVNGILNDEKRAAELAYQNAENLINPETGRKDLKPGTIYLMHIKPAENDISELIGVAYEKISNSLSYELANFLGYTNGVEIYSNALASRGNLPTASLGHSRGTLVQESAFTILANRSGESGSTYTNPNLTVRGVGGAVNAESYYAAAAKVQGPQGNRGKITSSYFSNDPVSTFTLSGGNPGAWTLQDLWQVFKTDNSMHSCYGTGGKGCTQVEAPVPGGAPGTPDGNAKLIQFKAGKMVNSNREPVAAWE
jgi:filamentous hemagglutinin